MKVRNPKSRYHLNIKRTDRVLEVGGGNNPNPRANVVVDKFVESNYHRAGDLKVLAKQKFMQADGEQLPFKDGEFDYVICCQVLEHVEDPVKFLAEQFRVAKRGYIETPSLLGEYLFPRESHKWILHEVNNTLYLVDKSKLGFYYGYDMGELIQDYLPTHSIGFKVVERTHPNLFTIRIEWEKDFKYEINPENPDIKQYFKGKWCNAWGDEFFPHKSMLQEFKDSLAGWLDVMKSVFKSKILQRF
jgi:SAM-dependent methyltransferase